MITTVQAVICPLVVTNEKLALAVPFWVCGLLCVARNVLVRNPKGLAKANDVGVTSVATLAGRAVASVTVPVMGPIGPEPEVTVIAPEVKFQVCWANADAEKPINSTTPKIVHQNIAAQ